MKPLADSRYDPLIWCGLCFLISFAGYWCPLLAAHFAPDAAYDSRIGGVILFTGPFVLAGGVRVVFACRALFLVRHQFGRGANLMMTLGLMFALGAVFPIIWFSLSIVIAIAFAHPAR